jgi:hypothetical protein
LDVRVVPKSADFARGEAIAVDVLISNVGPGPIKILESLAPEGWLIRLSLTDQNGTNVYSSTAVKVEVTAGMLRQITLAPRHIHGVEFELPVSLPTGAYQVQGTFSTTSLTGWQLADLPIGTWRIPPAKIAVK